MPCIRDLEDRLRWTVAIYQKQSLLLASRKKLLASAASNGLLVVHCGTNDISMVLTWHWANQTKLQAALANHCKQLAAAFTNLNYKTCLRMFLLRFRIFFHFGERVGSRLCRRCGGTPSSEQWSCLPRAVGHHRAMLGNPPKSKPLSCVHRSKSLKQIGAHRTHSKSLGWTQDKENSRIKKQYIYIYTYFLIYFVIIPTSKGESLSKQRVLKALDFKRIRLHHLDLKALQSQGHLLEIQNDTCRWCAKSGVLSVVCITKLS